MQEQPPILHREDRVHRERDWGIEYYNNISNYVISNAIRTPFQGDFLVRVDPRAEALGLEFGHFAIAQRAKTEQPMGFSPGKDVPERIALKGRPSAGHHSQ